jgi:hypothetical protein
MALLTTATVSPAGALYTAGVRAYFAPVDRTNALPVPFDPASMGRLLLDTPPPGWWSLGRVLDFERSSGSKITPVLSGAPAMVKTQVSSTIEEEVSYTFTGWTRLAIALSSGVQTLNLLLTASGASANPSGGASAPAELLQPGSTASVLQLATTTAVQAGDLVVVDADYTGQTGFIGSGAAGSYVATAPMLVDTHVIRRVSFNVARVLAVNAGMVTLASALPAGVPTAAMKIARCAGFVDCAGNAFLQEWSALFVCDGVQGDRLLLHYPRLQPAGGSSAESHATLAAGVDRWRPAARFRALSVTDANTGAASVCFRSYLPAPLRLI